MDFPPKVQSVIEQLKLEPWTVSVWLIGSRANGNSRPDSDWDFICFRKSPVEVQEARCEVVDVVQVGSDGKYLLEGQPPHLAGLFSNWKWNEIDSKSAEYKSRITPEAQAGAAFDLSDVKFVTYSAYKVWELNA